MSKKKVKEQENPIQRLNCPLTKNGVIVDIVIFIERFGGDILVKIKNQFKVSYKTTIGGLYTQNIHKTFKYKGRRVILFPRRGCFNNSWAKKYINVINQIQEGDEIEYDFEANLFANQELVANYLVNGVYCDEKANIGRGCCVLSMGAGLGKTHTAMGIIDKLKKKTIIVTLNSYLQDQWYTELKASFPEANIGKYSGKKKEDGDILIIIINSALLIDEEKLRKYDLVIYDEVHAYCSSSWSNVFWRLQTKYVLGLTATANESKTGMDKVFQSHVGPVIEANNIPDFKIDDVKFFGSVDLIAFNAEPKYAKVLVNDSNGMISVPLMIAQFIEDPRRNQVLVDEIKKLYEEKLSDGKNHTIMVFSDRRAHLITLKNLLYMQLGFIPHAPELEKEANTLMGGSTRETITVAKKEMRVILTTYGYSSTGVSIDRATALVFATPRKSNMKQIIGRILRRSGDTTIPRKIVDLIDNATCLKGQLRERKKGYRFYNLDILPQQIINYTDILLR